MTDALLWQVVSPRGVVSFLFGTMHVRDLHAFQSVDQVKRCIDSSEVFFSELEMAPSGMDFLSQFQSLPDSKTLMEYLSEHKYNRLRKGILKGFGLDIDHFQRLYPLIISNIVQTSVLNNASDVILDFHLFQYASDKGKILQYLESQEEQLTLFRNIPMDYQLKSLVQLGRQPSKAKKQINAILLDYAHKNTRQLYQRSKKQLGKLRRPLLYQRNENMVKRLCEELRTTPTFVGVGAAHLYGYKGILRLIKKEGYTIKPI